MSTESRTTVRPSIKTGTLIFPRQTRVLADSLFIMAVASESRDDAIAWRELDRLAELHSRAGLDVGPELYGKWLECLIDAARRHDPAFSAEVESAISTLPGVADVHRISDPFKLVSRQHHPERSTVWVRGVPIGPDTFTFIAGPCAVESPQQTLEAVEMA